MLDWLGPVWAYWQFPMERMCGIIVASVGSRIQANRNLSLNILQQEQLHSLRYLSRHPPLLAQGANSDDDYGSSDEDLPSSHIAHPKRKTPSLKSIFRKRLHDRGPRVHDILLEDQDEEGVVTLVGPTKVSLQHYERQLIKHWYQSHWVDIHMDQIAITYTAWKKIRLSTGHFAKCLYFTQSSQAMRDSLRDSSVVQYEVINTNTGLRLSHYGHLLLIVTTEIPLHDEVEMSDTFDLALIQRFNIESDEDGNLLRIINKSQREFILSTRIKQLVGRIRKQGVDYLVGQYTAFMVWRVLSAYMYLYIYNCTKFTTCVLLHMHVTTKLEIKFNCDAWA